MRDFLAAASGILFGAGLAISGMMDPARVRGFLDIFGDWDPTLAFVMGGALIVMALAWVVQRRMTTPFADEKFHLPGTSNVDRKLIGGALLFGVGWGVAGLCPGPGVASLGVNPGPALIFLLAMFAGMAMHKLVVR